MTAIKRAKKQLNSKQRRRIHFAITFALMVLTVLLAFLKFPQVFNRTVTAAVDLGKSFAYYCLFWVEKENAIVPMVQVIPEGMDAVLPLSFEELELLLQRFWSLFTNADNLEAFFQLVMEKIADVATFVSLWTMPILIMVLVAWGIYRNVDNKYNKDTKAVKALKKWRKTIWFPIKAAINRYFIFLKEHKVVRRLLVTLWFYNLNFITIELEFVAWYLYLCVSSDFMNIFVQVAKFAVDWSVVGLFVPTWGWMIIGWAIFHAWRCSLGVKKLNGFLDKDEEFALNHPGALFVVGKQRSKKTSMLTMLKLVIERIFRKAAYERLLKRDKQFPFFPWINLERFIDRNRREHKIYMLCHCRNVIRQLRQFYMRGFAGRKAWKKFKHKYGYEYDNFVFDYDETFGVEYDNELDVVHLFDALEKYAQLYFIYSNQKPYDINNYSIREDFGWKTFGNFPIFDGDLLNKTTKESLKNSQYSQRMDGDAFRLGYVFDAQNPYRNAVEYGIGIYTEFAKERKNKQTKSIAKDEDKKLQAQGRLNENVATQDNDFFELDVKMRGHAATVDNFTFFRWLFDDQRAGSLGADNKDLTDICHIKGVAEEKMVLPFFEFFEAFYRIATAIYDKVYAFIRNRKGSNTTLIYVLKMLYTPLFKFYDRIYNKFTVYTLNVNVQDGGDGQMLGTEQFYILSYVTYRNRFATDSFNLYWDEKARGSKFGLEDMKQYESIYPTFADYEAQHSYAVEDLSKGFRVSKRREKVNEEVKKPRKKFVSPLLKKKLKPMTPVEIEHKKAELRARIAKNRARKRPRR